jgi:hypothetical protein
MTAPIRTRAGWAGLGENYFGGRKVGTDLLGHHGFWSMVSLALGHRPLTRAEERLLDDAVVAMNASDPRIWPIKMTWLIGSYGSAVAGAAAGSLWRDGARVGSSPARAAAACWLELHAALASSGERAIAIADWFRGRKDAGILVPGFGVPARQQDERVVLLDRVVRQRGFADGSYFALLGEVTAVLERTSTLRPNVVGAMSALALDLGFQPDQIPELVQVGLWLSLLANGVDAAVQQPEVLREMPSEAVCYQGPAPRRSPRAEEVS